MADQVCSSRPERQRQRLVLHRSFQESGSKDGLPTIRSRRVESVMARSAVGRRIDTVMEPPLSRLPLPQFILYNRKQVLESADESLDSNHGEYEGNDGQSEESQESEENESGQHGDNMDHPLPWGAQRPIGCEFFSSQHSIQAITP